MSQILGGAAGGGTGGATFTGGVSNLGNTGGTTGVVTNRMVIAGGDNITASESSAAGGATVSLVGNAPFVGGVSNIGNTGGDTGVSSTRMVLVGSNNVTLSQTTGANGVTVGINGAAGGGGGTISNSILWDMPNPQWGATAWPGNGSISVFPWNVKNNASFSQANVFVSGSFSTSSNSSWAGVISGYVGVYTRNASTLSLASSGSNAIQWTVTGNSNTVSLSGIRAFPVTFAALSLTPGDYWLGFFSVTSTTNANWFTMSNIVAISRAGGVFSGNFNAATNATAQIAPGYGLFSVSTNAVPSSIGFSEITGGVTASIREALYMNFVNYTA